MHIIPQSGYRADWVIAPCLLTAAYSRSALLPPRCHPHCLAVPMACLLHSSIRCALRILSLRKMPPNLPTWPRNSCPIALYPYPCPPLPVIPYLSSLTPFSRCESPKTDDLDRPVPVMYNSSVSLLLFPKGE